MEQNEEQKKEFFQELKQIYNINIPIPEPPVNRENQPQKVIIYIDLTNNQIQSNEMLYQSFNNCNERKWLGGFLGEFRFINKKQEQQHIFCYYFNKLIENDEKINIQNLFRFRLFLQEFISTQQNYQTKYVLHFSQNNKNQKEFEDHIIKFVYQILEGSFNELKDIICLYNEERTQQINYCKISSKKIHFKKNQSCLRCDLSFIVKLDEFLNYFKFKQNDPNIIGFECQKYVQQQVNVVLEQFENKLICLQSDISKMLKFPVNLNNEKVSNKNVSEYLDTLKQIICEIFLILSEQTEFEQMIIKLQQLLINFRDKIIQNLIIIVEEITQFEIYLRLSYKDESPDKVFKQLLQFSFFNLIESDSEILQKLKKHNFNTDYINATLFRVKLDMLQQFKQFNLQLPQSLAYLKRIISKNENISQEKPYIFVLGMTKVGKSTLLNMLSYPQHIIINKDNKFDVNVVDKQFIISHNSNSKTFQIQRKEIDNFIFFDTPGLRDTNQMNRIINQIQLCYYITSERQKILLMMIDGSQLETSKNDFIDSIDALNLIFGNQQDNQCFENLILPVFTKIKNDSTMKQIQDKWESEVMKDITNNNQLKILKAIKNSIDEGNYIKINCAEYYSIEHEHQQLQSEIQQLQDRANDCFLNDKIEEGKDIIREVNQKKVQQKNLQNQSFSQKIQKIKDDLIGKCQSKFEQVSNTRQNINQSLKFQLNEELKKFMDDLLLHMEKCYQYYFNVIANDFIIYMLYDHSSTINNKLKKSYKIIKKITLNLQQLNLKGKKIRNRNELNELNDFYKEILQKFDIKVQDQKLDCESFKLQLDLLNKCYINVVPTYIHLYEQLKYEWRDFNPQEIFFNSVMTTIYIPIILISHLNDIFKNNLFVSEQEKEKQEKLNLFKIQQEYQNYLPRGK